MQCNEKKLASIEKLKFSPSHSSKAENSVLEAAEMRNFAAAIAEF
jgi:hypothetical protein